MYTRPGPLNCSILSAHVICDCEFLNSKLWAPFRLTTLCPPGGGRHPVGTASYTQVAQFSELSTPSSNLQYNLRGIDPFDLLFKLSLGTRCETASGHSCAANWRRGTQFTRLPLYERVWPMNLNPPAFFARRCCELYFNMKSTYCSFRYPTMQPAQLRSMKTNDIP